MAEPFLAELRIMSFNFAPSGWAQCNGQLLPINQNQALFSLLGTNYGGNGQTTFALPDLRGRTPVHQGDGLTIGTKFGEETHTVTIAELPTHPHQVVADTTVAPGSGGNQPDTNKRLAANDPGFLYAGPSAFLPMNAGAIGNVGGSQPHPNQQPFMALMFCIALQGIFPSQN
jgi:microcystin-dependent protein